MSTISSFKSFKQFIKNLISGESLRKSSLNILIAQSVFVVLFLIADIIFARVFSKADFGIWKQLVLIVNLGIPIFSLGFPEGFKYYIALEPEKKQYHTSSVFSILILSTLLLFILSLFFGKNIIAYFFKNFSITHVVVFIPFIFLVFILNKVFRYIMINYKKTQSLLLGSFLALFFGLLTIMSTAIIYKKQPSLYLFSAAMFIFIIYFISFINLFSKLQLQLKFTISKIQTLKYLKYGFPLYLASFIGIIIVNVDKAIVNAKDTLEAFAVYSVGAIEIPVFGMISASVSQAYFPKMVANISQGDKPAAQRIWLNTTIKISYITYPLIILLMLFSPLIIKIFFGERYAGAIPIFKTYLLVALWRNNSYGAIISASGITKWITFYSVITVVLNLVGALFLYQNFGMKGVAYSCFFATSITGILYLIHEKLIKDFVRIVLFNPFILVTIIIIIIEYIYIN